MFHLLLPLGLLFVTSATAQQAGDLAEAPEPNDTIWTASALQCGRQGVGYVGFADTDLWGFTLSGETEVSVVASRRDATGSTVLSLNAIDPFQRNFPALWAPDGTTILEPFTIGLDRTRFSLERLLEPGTYFIRDSIGFFQPLPYTLTVDCRPISGPFGVATHTLSGTPCTGVAGNTPTIITRERELPLSGSTYSVFLTDTDDGSGNFVWALLGVDPVLSPGIDLAGIGAPGCFLYVQPVATFPLTNTMSSPPRTPVLTLTWHIVNDPTVLGRSFSVQGVVWSDPELLTTNVLTATVGNWLL